MIKYLVFGFNVFFWFIGIAICAAGFYAWIEKDTISNLSKLSKIPFDPALVLIVVGGVMFVLGEDTFISLKLMLLLPTRN